MPAMSKSRAVLQQLVYGSTPYSAGYSVLGKSTGFDEELVPLLIHECERYDGQLYAAPMAAYSLVCGRLRPGLVVVREVFGGWYDQVGRPSRVMRSIVLDSDCWQLLAGNPFVLHWLLPPVSRCISRRRNDVHTIAPLCLGDLSPAVWHKVWWRETSRFWKAVSRLDSGQMALLAFLRSQDEPFQPREISSEHDQSEFCRLLIYSVPHSKRLQLELETFSLQERPASGLSFRYRPYCRQPFVMPQRQVTPALDLPILLECVTRSLPAPHDFAVLARLWRRRQRLAWLFALTCAVAAGAAWLLGKC